MREALDHWKKQEWCSSHGIFPLWQFFFLLQPKLTANNADWVFHFLNSRDGFVQTAVTTAHIPWIEAETIALHTRCMKYASESVPQIHLAQAVTMLRSTDFWASLCVEVIGETALDCWGQESKFTVVFFVPVNSGLPSTTIPPCRFHWSGVGKTNRNKELLVCIQAHLLMHFLQDDKRAPSVLHKMTGTCQVWRSELQTWSISIDYVLFFILDNIRYNMVQ